MQRLLSFVLVVAILVACRTDDEVRGVTTYVFTPATRTPRTLRADEILLAAQRGKLDVESLTTVTSYVARGLGETIVQAVVEDGNDSRAYVVDEDGVVLPTAEFWDKEKAIRERRFGKMDPDLFDAQAGLPDDAVMDVYITVLANLPQPELPYDGTDKLVATEEYQRWFTENARAQAVRIRAAKQRLLTFLAAQSSSVVLKEDPNALPLVRALVPTYLLRSAELNAPDIVRIDPVPQEGPALLGHAGRTALWGATPNAEMFGGLSGGLCGTHCDGSLITVGLWERDAAPTGQASGLAFNNTRISTDSQISGYFECPQQCTSDANCATTTDVVRFCRSPTPAGQKICVQDHLSWTAASVGMSGTYNYNTIVPGGVNDPMPNLPGGNGSVTFQSTGTWHVKYRVGNEIQAMGFDYLVDPAAVGGCPAGGAAAPYINRSQADTPFFTDFAGRVFGTFVTAASGNNETFVVECAKLKNGLCVGSLDYATYNLFDSHRRTGNSSFLNNGSFDNTLERPHLLGPGSHQGTTSGLHLPSVDVVQDSQCSPPLCSDGSGSHCTVRCDLMRWGDDTSGNPQPQILGTSFSAPTILSAAIQAHEYEGWFSSLAFPMVNKAVLMASTRDSNIDGAVGKRTVWSQNAPTVDAEDGAGQINFAALKGILDNNRYFFDDLLDSDFTSCGTGCRKVTVGSVSIVANQRFRVALAWQSCALDQISVPVMKNDLDLALNCGSPLLACGGTTISNTVSSELEMLERPGCTTTRTCSIEVRIKNGIALARCGGMDPDPAVERVGVAWSFNN